MVKITSKTTLENIIKKKGAEEILHKYGLPCLSCPMAQFEMDKLRIGDVGEMYGLETKKIINELNKIK